MTTPGSRVRRVVGILVFWGAAVPPFGSGQRVPPPLERPARLSVERLPLVTSLRQLQSSSGVHIAFSPEAIPDLTVSCACASHTVGEALEVLLAEAELTFMERRSQVLILPKEDADSEGAESGLFGRVSQEDGTPVASARVEIRALGMTGFSDSDGRFALPSIPPGSYVVDVEALGFRSSTAIPVDVAAGFHGPIQVVLERNPLALAEIVVSPGTFGMLEEAPLFPQALSREEMEVLPQLGEDVFRTLERMPGVATDDISAKLNVRGGNDDELLIVLDGAELFEPYHMRDLDAALGVVDVATLEGANLVAGGLPTEHGDRLTGMLDMRTRQPRGGDARHSVGFSVSNITARTQGSFDGGRGGWLLSGRRGFLDLVLALAEQTSEETNDELSPQYFDVLGKVEYLAGESHRFSIHMLLAGDNLDLEVQDPPFERAALGTQWTNANLWAGWDWALTPSVEASTVLSGVTMKRRRLGDLVSPGSSEVADFIDVDDRSDFTLATLRQDWRASISDGAVVKAGAQVRLANADYRYRSTVGREFVAGDGSVGVAYDTTAVDLDPSSTETSLYLAARVRPLPAVTAEAGLRHDHQSHTSESHLSPRVQAALEVGPTTHLRASWGLYRQSHGVEELSVVDGETDFFPAETARQIALGVEHRFGSGLQARLEGYRRLIRDPRIRYVNVGREIIPFPEAGNDRVGFLPDEGRAQGLELVLAGPIGAGSGWSASYVLAKAEDRMDEEWIPRTLDQRHTLGLRWHAQRGDDWSFSAGFQYHSGWPSTPMAFQVDTVPTAGPAERSILVTEVPGRINSRRLPAYHRVDVRATRSFEVGDGRLSVFLDVFNLYNRKNLRSFDYKVRLPEGTVIANTGETLLPLLPSFGFTWEF